MSLLLSPVALYFHIPFCTHRCAYCDFNTYAGQEALIPAYVEALTRELDFIGSHLRTTSAGKKMSHQVHTVFFGGGTPSLLTADQFRVILGSIGDHFSLTENVEITMEANPGTVSYEKLRALREIDINRISFGVQSANAEELRMLERTHNFFDVIDAVRVARQAGFENLNLDLIYGLPEQTLQSWQTTVQRILGLRPEHISAYALTLEHGTPFGKWASKGWLPLPDPDLAADMYEWLSATLENCGYRQYEISNWALPGHECRHNLQYWRGRPYVGVGAGAHGYAGGYRYSNVLRIKTYIEHLADNQYAEYDFPFTPATVNHHRQSRKDDMSEFMMTGLRLTREGVSEAEFQTRFDQSMHGVYGQEIDALLRLGLIENGNGDRITLTRRGRLLGNQVFMRFL